MNKIKCLLVDDEPPALELLEKYASMIQQLEVVGTSNSAISAFDFLSQERVDLIFLDIQMPLLNGIDFLKSLQHPPSVILTTAYREYALDGYDLDIVDYLLKPIPFERFLRAIERYKSKHTPAVSPPVEPSRENEYFFCKVNRTQHKIYFDHILYVESLKDYVRIYTTERAFVVKGNLGSYMKLLPPARFTRVHRSFAVSNQSITAYNHKEVRIGNKKIPIGGSYRSAFQQVMYQQFPKS
ncbi:MAG: response regulator transcription factor [Bacteroidota bacterium]